MRFGFRRHIRNNFIVILVSLPNALISLGTISALSYFWHWSFVLAPTVYWALAQVLSVQYSAAFGQVTEMSFKVMGKQYRYHAGTSKPR